VYSRNTVCCRYITVNILHKGDNKDNKNDDDDDNNNNNNSATLEIIRTLKITHQECTSFPTI
jgi:hypothetical protein